MFYREKEFMEAESRVPKGWTTQKLKQMVESVKGRKPNSLVEEQLEGYLPYLSTGYLRSNEETKFTEPYEGSTLIEDGDLILLWDGSNAGEFFSGKKGVLSSTMVKLELKNRAINPRYLFYFLKSMEAFLQSQTRGTGIPHVDRAVLENLSVFIAPTQEQHKITEVLSCVDLAIQKTDEVIAKTERLKKGLMQQLLTRGIGHKEFKDTEIGKIPKKWNMVSIYDIKSNINRAIVSGPFGSNIGKRFFVKEGVPLIRGNNLTLGEQLFVDDGFVYITEEKAEELKSCEALPNDLIFTAAGTLGQVGLIPKNSRFSRYIISNKQLRARIDENRALPLFLFYWFTGNIIKRIFKQRKTGTSIPVINLGVLRRLPIPLPESIEEQRQICEILSAVDGKLGFERRQKNNLERIKQALMDLLLTGKVRVRVD